MTFMYDLDSYFLKRIRKPKMNFLFQGFRSYCIKDIETDTTRNNTTPLPASRMVIMIIRNNDTSIQLLETTIVLEMT